LRRGPSRRGGPKTRASGFFGGRDGGGFGAGAADGADVDGAFPMLAARGEDGRRRRRL
jgi:hypothetical protein